MKYTVICNIPMHRKPAKKYVLDDNSDDFNCRELVFPINAILEKKLTSSDCVTVLLLTKNSINDQSKECVEVFRKELEEVNKNIGASLNYIEINTDFKQNRMTHETLLSSIIDNVEDDTHVMADITHGPKDMPIIVFAACSFAENHLRCQIDNIVYGQVDFDTDGNPINPRICDMTALYYLNAVTNTISSNDPSKARQMLHNLIVM